MSWLERLRPSEGLLDATLVRVIDDPVAGTVTVLLGLLVAVVVGAVHALGPGHGKVLVGAYLASSRGRPRDAVALGVLVAAMHTGSVLLLAFVLHTAERASDGSRFEVVLTAAVGCGIAVLGVRMLHARWRGRHRAPDPVPAGVGAHATAHDHGHHHGHGHTHGHDHSLPPGVSPLSRGGMLALAGAGGLSPSPAALLVLLTAVATGRTSFGIALLLAFSVGLAVTLTAVGLAIVRGRAVLDRHAARPGLAWVVAKLPVAGGVVVLAGGLLLTASALATW